MSDLENLAFLDGYQALIDWWLDHDGPWPLNPWQIHTPEGVAWKQGWNDACAEECAPELERKRNGRPVNLNATNEVNANNLGILVLFGAVSEVEKEIFHV